MASSMDTPCPIVGFWIDQTQNFWGEFQVTTTTQVNSSVQLIIGVLFGVAAPWLSDILVRCFEWLRYWMQNRNRISSRKVNDDQRLLLPHGQVGLHYGTYSQPTASTVQDEGMYSEHPQNQTADAPFGYLPSSPALNVRKTRSTDRGWKSLMGALCLYAVVSIGWALAGGFSTTLQTSSSGLSDSQVCGSWSLRGDASEKEMNDDDLLQARKEIRAGQYARDCYSSRPVTNPNQCAFFYNRTIAYSVTTKQECPFVDKSFCAEGVSTAACFTTGWVDGSVLGLNSQKAPQFRRTTECVPLDLSRGFVKQVPSKELRFDYYLGFTNDHGEVTNYTYRQYGDPFKWDVPAYSVSAYESTPYSELDYWHPIAALARPRHTYMTLLFISSCRIVYKGPSEDYIFRANAPYANTGRYWNPNPRARPLVCIDSTEMRSADNIISYIDQEDPQHREEHEFVRSALRKSTTFQSIQFRLGSGLVAQESVGDFESLPLSDDQWVLESEALFATSLARIQYDALDIAIGAGHEKDPGPYRQDTIDWARDKLCGLYKFQLPKEYTNINLLATLGFVALVAFLMIMALETSVQYSDDKKDWFRGNMMVFELMIAGVLQGVGWLLERFRDAGQTTRAWFARAFAR